MSKYVLNSLLSYAIYLTITYFSVFEDRQWAYNLLTFLTWAGLTIYAGTLIPDVLETTANSLAKKPKGLPGWISSKVIAVMIFAFASRGWFATATAWLVIAIAGSVLMDRVKEIRNKATA